MIVVGGRLEVYPTPTHHQPRGRTRAPDTRQAPLGELTPADVPKVPAQRGFASKLAKVAAKWPTLRALADAENVADAKPDGVGAAWLNELQAAVKALLERAATTPDPMAVDEEREGEGGEEEGGKGGESEGEGEDRSDDDDGDDDADDESSDEDDGDLGSAIDSDSDSGSDAEYEGDDGTGAEAPHPPRLKRSRGVDSSCNDSKCL